MELLPKEVQDQLPPLGSQDGKGMDAIAQVRFFTPTSNWTWWATDFEPETRTFFGLVEGFERELGYFSLDELQEVRGPFGLGIERDLYWDPKPLKEVTMPVRNYADPDPKVVLRNMADVLSNQDMNRLHEPAYKFLITHCGFIAHYNIEGFRAVYRDHLDDFVEAFINQLGMGWECFLDNPKSHLFDVSYRGVMLHEVIRDLLAIFQRYKEQTRTVAQARRRAQKMAVLNSLAGELGYTLVPQEVTHAQET